MITIQYVSICLEVNPKKIKSMRGGSSRTLSDVMEEYPLRGEEWMELVIKDKGLLRLIDQTDSEPGNILLIIGATMCFFSSIISMFFVAEGSYAMLFGIGMMYFGITQESSVGQSVTISRFSYGVFAVIIISTFVLEAVSDRKPKVSRSTKRTKKAKKAKAA